jgi:hypothetical protein
MVAPVVAAFCAVRSDRELERHERIVDNRLRPV